VSGWYPQEGPQADLCVCPMQEVFFGGARGGGKTDGVLGKWALKERRYGTAFNAIMFRRTTVSAEDAIERSKEIYGPLGGKFNERPPRWRMPHGGRVSFAYLETVQDAKEYQGRNVTDAWVEEAGQYPLPAPIFQLFGVLRSAHGVPIQLILTGNPGGAGQHWIRERYGMHPFPLGPKVLRRKLPDGSEHRVAVIPSRIRDNKILLRADPGYVNRLQLVGSPQLVKAWLDGDWTAVEGAFFPEWSEKQHVVPPFAIPDTWLRFRSGDWGSAAPFSVGWWAVVGDDFDLRRIAIGGDDRLSDSGMESAAPRGGDSIRDRGAGGCGGVAVLPRGALVRYREWYGASAPNVGLNLFAEEFAKGIIEREKGDPRLAYAVLDPSTFSEAGGPSIAERANAVLQKAKLVAFHEADNRRITRVVGDAQKSGPMGGWDQFRGRLVGKARRDEQTGEVLWSTGRPMIYCFSTCTDSIRTVPVLQHDPVRAEDLDTEAEDHAADEWRYACMSRPYVKVIPIPERPKDSYRPGAEVINEGDSLILL